MGQIKATDVFSLATSFSLHNVKVRFLKADYFKIEKKKSECLVSLKKF